MPAKKAIASWARSYPHSFFLSLFPIFAHRYLAAPHNMQFLLNHISTILERYTGALPLAIFLKDYFNQHPKLGSRDRKALSEAVFTYYRYAKFFPADSNKLEIIAWAISRPGQVPSLFLKRVLASISAGVSLGLNFDSDQNIPELSLEIERREWLQSLLEQPQLFIRLRKNRDQSLSIFDDNNIEYKVVSGDNNSEGVDENFSISLPNGTAVAKMLNEEDFIVQDWASQYSIQMIASEAKPIAKTVWDVCSGAGGKSIFLKEKLNDVALLSTDIRQTILHNLSLRFKQYKIKKPEIKVLDATDAKATAQLLGDRKFDLIVCDVPCSGSGTWARTPEQFYFFDPNQVDKFRQLQYPIAFNAQNYLADGGLFAYITCSVFSAENEVVVQQLLATTPLELVHQQVINGLPYQADSMFVAMFRKKE